jgi:predicted dehydrogenase
MMTSREKLRVAVAGTSFGGNVQIPVFQSFERTRVVAVSSRRAERAEKVAKDHGIPAHYTDFEQMLDAERPDIVSIVTPPNLHFPMVMAALSRGIHILCEKPFAMNAGEAAQMKAAADRSAVVGMVDFEFRYCPARAYALDLVREGYVGEVRMADFIVHFGQRSEPNDAPFDWWSEESKGGGLLGAFGSHVMDTFRLFLGEPRRLIADVVTFVKSRQGGTVTSDDSFSVLIEFKSGVRAVVQMTNASGTDDVRFGISGNRGQLVITDIFGNELRGGKRLGSAPSERVTTTMEIPEKYRLNAGSHPLQAPFGVLLARMVDAVDRGIPSPDPNFEDGLQSQIMLDAIRLSAKEARWVDL